MEIFDTLNRQGIYCDLLTGASVGRWDVTIRFWMHLTGQEKKRIPGARITSATIEMIDLQKLYDVAIVDEIQVSGVQLSRRLIPGCFCYA